MKPVLKFVFQLLRMGPATEFHIPQMRLQCTKHASAYAAVICNTARSRACKLPAYAEQARCSAPQRGLEIPEPDPMQLKNNIN